jgi:CMP-N,N'-diacetyllegionaminic acid synthase
MFKKKKIVAIIPARKGSKGIKNKNLIKIIGIPLIKFSIDYAKKSTLIDKVFVSTDGDKISKISKKYGAEIISRPKNLSNDFASSDSAVMHAIHYINKILKYNFDIVVFLQPTTALRKLGELDSAIKLHVKKNVDTVFSSVDYDPFLWKKRGKFFSPVSFNPYKRKRRQTISSINETGSFYITKKKSFLKYKNRFGKKVINYNCDYHSILEIDKFKDYVYINDLIKTNIPKKYKLCIPKKN